MKLLYILILVVICIAIYYSINKRESFDTKELEPSKRVLVSKGSHSTIATVTPGTNNEFVILIHDYPLSQAVWEPVHSDLYTRSCKGESIPTLITYDLRGCGTANSAKVSAKYLDIDPNNYAWSLELFAADLYQVYSQLVNIKDKKVSVGGWGFGGCIAQQFALQHSYLIDNLYLFSTLGAAVTNLSPVIETLSALAEHQSIDSMATLPVKYINTILCDWFSCPKDENTVDYTLVRSLLTAASVDAELQVLKLIETLDLLTLWSETKKYNYNIVFIAPLNDSFSSPNKILRLYSMVKNKYSGTDEPTLLTPAGNHYFAAGNPDYVVTLICDTCKSE